MTYLAVQDPLVALLVYSQLNVGGIRGGDIWLSHEESRSDLAIKKWLQPSLLLGVGAVLGQHLHVAGIRGSAVGGLYFPISMPQWRGRSSKRTSLAVRLLPKISAMRPYSKLEKPAPSLKWFFGRNMFHRPSFFAFSFSSSMMAGCELKRSSMVLPICCCQCQHHASLFPALQLSRRTWL